MSGSRLAATVGAGLALGATWARAWAAAAAPAPELLREEVYNYRIVGELPAGWERRADTLVWTFSVDGIPHAHVHLFRERLGGDAAVEAQVRARATHYRFPNAPEDAREEVATVDWAGRPAVRFLHEARIQGVLCRRRVTALCVRETWYELIETVYGAETEELDGCTRGLRTFRDGFRILVPPLPAGEGPPTTAPETLSDEALGFSVSKPEGFTRVDVDPARDPGCRVAFEAQAGDPRRKIRVRFFEYGVRDELDAEEWIGIFFDAFHAIHRQARREEAEAPAVRGARLVRAVRFLGERDGAPIRTLLLLVHAESGRVFALRVRTAHGAEEEFAAAIEAIVSSLALR